MKITAKKILMPEGFRENGTILVEEGVVRGIVPAVKGDIECDFAVPGLIDQHLHGGYGADVMHSDEETVLNWLRFLLRNGNTQVLAGVYTAPVPLFRKALQTMRNVMELQKNGAGGALLSGVHLEGPFLSPDAPGAMLSECMLEPTVENWRLLTDGYEDMVRLVTLAPELPNVEPLLAYLTGKGIPVSAGHTAASAEEGARGFANGVGCVTHFFNASTPIHHRKPGILTEALLDDRVYCETICDFVHVHPSAVRLIHRCKGENRMIIVSDAVHTTGLPDGTYVTDLDTTVVKNGVSRTPEGALCGGGHVQLGEVRNLISIGIDAAQAFHMASQTPAGFLRMAGGKIIPGARAEILCMDSRFAPILTILGNTKAEGDKS